MLKVAVVSLRWEKPKGESDPTANVSFPSAYIPRLKWKRARVDLVVLNKKGRPRRPPKVHGVRPKHVRFWDAASVLNQYDIVHFATLGRSENKEWEDFHDVLDEVEVPRMVSIHSKEDFENYPSWFVLTEENFAGAHFESEELQRWCVENLDKFFEEDKTVVCKSNEAQRLVDFYRQAVNGNHA